VSLALAVAAGVFCAVGVYLLMQRSITRIVLGVGALGNGINMIVLMAGRTDGRAPIVGQDGPLNDPYPQAFILTAIVIGLAITAFMVALAWRSWTIDGKDTVEDDIEDRRIMAEVPGNEAWFDPVPTPIGSDDDAAGKSLAEPS
jgi:multicomponent Na+:H+ antiporter subunit C